MNPLDTVCGYRPPCRLHFDANVAKLKVTPRLPPAKPRREDRTYCGVRCCVQQTDENEKLASEAQQRFVAQPGSTIVDS